MLAGPKINPIYGYNRYIQRKSSTRVIGKGYYFKQSRFFPVDLAVNLIPGI